MQMWFSQYHTVNVKLDVRIQEQLFSGQSDYQKIDVFKSYEFGKMVALDGEIVFRTQMSLYMMRWSHMCRWRFTRMPKRYL